MARAGRFGELRIARVLQVEDTRQWEERSDDRWYPIPGSGSENHCERCGRRHEVWVHVELTDGSRRIFGTGCAGKMDPVGTSRFARVETALERLRELYAKMRRLLAEAEEYERVAIDVAALQPPPCERVRQPRRYGGGDEDVLRCGDGWVRIDGGWVSPRDEAAAIWDWRRLRHAERTRVTNHPARKIDEVSRDVAKTERRLVELLGPDGVDAALRVVLEQPRTLAELADVLQLPAATTRERLDAAHAAGSVDVVGDRAGEVLWGLFSRTAPVLDGHAFERAGLGRAPFQVWRVFRRFTMTEFGPRPAGECEFCGAAIDLVISLKPSDPPPRLVHVGVECLMHAPELRSEALNMIERTLETS